MPKIPTMHVTDAKFVWDHIRSSNPSAGLKDLPAGADLIIIKEAVKRIGVDARWLPDTFQLGDVFTKDKAVAQDIFRGTWMAGKHQIFSEAEGLALKARARTERAERGRLMAETSKQEDLAKKTKALTSQTEEKVEMPSISEDLQPQRGSLPEEEDPLEEGSPDEKKKKEKETGKQGMRFKEQSADLHFIASEVTETESVESALQARCSWSVVPRTTGCRVDWRLRSRS